MRALLTLCFALTIQLVLSKNGRPNSDQGNPLIDDPENAYFISPGIKKVFPELPRVRRDAQNLPTLNGQAENAQGPVFKLPKFPTTKAPESTTTKAQAQAPVKSAQGPSKPPVKTPAVQAKPIARSSAQGIAGKVPTPVAKLQGKLPTNAPAKAQGKPPAKQAKGSALRKAPNKVKTATPANVRKPNGKGQALRKRKNIKRQGKNKYIQGKNKNRLALRQRNNKKKPNNQKVQKAGRSNAKPSLAAKPGVNQAANAAAMNQAATKKSN